MEFNSSWWEFIDQRITHEIYKDAGLEEDVLDFLNKPISEEEKEIRFSAAKISDAEVLYKQREEVIKMLLDPPKTILDYGKIVKRMDLWFEEEKTDE